MPHSIFITGASGEIGGALARRFSASGRRLFVTGFRNEAALSELLGDCKAAVLRELTKKFESVYRGTPASLAEKFSEEPKGECVIAVLPNPERTDAPDPDALLRELLTSLSVKEAAAVVSEKLHIPKKQAYAMALEQKARAEEQES